MCQVRTYMCSLNLPSTMNLAKVEDPRSGIYQIFRGISYRLQQFHESNQKKNKIIWNPNEYINVMVYNFKKTKDNSITLGISNLPYKQNGYPAIDGLKDAKGAINKNSLSFEYCVSINSSYINQESSRYTAASRIQRIHL